MKIKSCLCVHAERIYVEYLGATLLDMEHVTCYCKSEPRKVKTEYCDKCEKVKVKEDETNDLPEWAKTRVHTSYRKYFVKDSGE